MSANTSSRERAGELLAGLRSGKGSIDDVRAFAEAVPDDFFRMIVEALSDSFSEDDARIYEQMMRAWIPERDWGLAVAPEDAVRVYVLSRVTLGADIKITGVVLDAAKRRYPRAEIVLVGGAKTAELFAGDPRVRWMEANYPRSGSVAAKLAFARGLRLDGGIVIDPDSRFTQLGLVAPCDASRYFHFPSRTYRATSDVALGALANEWMMATFGVAGEAYLPVARWSEAQGPAGAARNSRGTTFSAAPGGQNLRGSAEGGAVAVSLGVGENPAKRVGDGFESELLRLLGSKYGTIYVDRGAGGEERERVDKAVREAGIDAHFCEGSFADFVAVIGRCDAYVGYDSAGQHAAAALGVRVTTIFAGAPNERFRMRWRPEGKGEIRVIAADGLNGNTILKSVC